MPETLAPNSAADAKLVEDLNHLAAALLTNLSELRESLGEFRRTDITSLQMVLLRQNRIDSLEQELNALKETLNTNSSSLERFSLLCIGLSVPLFALLLRLIDAYSR